MRIRAGTVTRAVGIALTLLLAGAAPPVDDASLVKQAQGIFAPLPKTAATAEYPVTPARVALGRMLFFDPRLSVDGTASCVRCHLPQLYGTDALPWAHGNRDRANPHNSPTVLNAALQISAHWIGDRKDIEEQATRSLIGPATMGNPDFSAALAKIKAVPTYVTMFQQAFPAEATPVTPENFGKAVGAYERTLLTPSRFDQYLAGKVSALSTKERAGLRKFIEIGCSNCHNGVGIGGGSYRKFGTAADYWTETGSTVMDKGRFAFTQNEADMYVFKVSSLRNVAMTAPYFHDGSVATLPEAVRIMAKIQRRRDLTAEDNEDIVAFLGSLTGTLPDNFVRAPMLPPAAFKPGN